jgi:phosphomannomutase/phosphoglucomutase
LIEGLKRQGCKVIDIGLVATPMLYFEVVEEDLAAGFMVTASHNPSEHNGVRICGKKALDLTYETGIGQIESNFDKDFKERDCGEVVEKEIYQDFADKVVNSSKKVKGFKVVLDHGNGSSTLVGKEIFSRIGCEVIEINEEIDGEFPGRGPSPDENPEPLKNRVRKEKADLGVAFDADSDRAFFVDEEGEEIANDLILALFVKNFIQPGEYVIYDVKCSKALEDVIEESGARKIQNRTGMSYIKRKMVEKEAELGGELSGHFFFKENDYYDDPFYAAARLLEIMSEKGKLSNLVDGLPKYFSSPELRPDCRNKEEVVEKIKEEFSDERIVNVDGAKIYFDQGWALVRTSSTEEKLSIRFEAISQDSLESIRERVMKTVENYREK